MSAQENRRIEMNPCETLIKQSITLDSVVAYTSPIVQCSPLHQKSSE